MTRFKALIFVSVLSAFVTGAVGCAEFSEVVGGKDVRSSEKVSKRRGDARKVRKDSLEEHAFIWPVEGGRVTSGFGRRRSRAHDGIDIVIEKGTPVMASRSGEVIFSGRFRGYGNLIVLKHPENFFTAYGHLLESRAKKGERVRQGEVIGLVGRSGRASTPHLHFEIREKTVPTDPIKYLPDTSSLLPLRQAQDAALGRGQGEGEDDNG